ncbi:uncharacterized protein FOMMEDRAFT_159481 [Fomitiporia mediterranea MF3/22]|uniref:uncharacterized protein n=1 Tax=Fomitiporia mediterranea (strain MF3/22) TaxID=694068 RepID=UPI0004408D4A|nr:uncharacterized protein FOMMEDRAFT_159481 [Fomitiporia mediterranea MF3/22]EJD00688.1 hypothetical protein FOMMEDRAFT_159481 [Fomitiporia mediterranea MF3/22]
MVSMVKNEPLPRPQSSHDWTTKLLCNPASWIVCASSPRIRFLRGLDMDIRIDHVPDVPCSTREGHSHSYPNTSFTKGKDAVSQAGTPRAVCKLNRYNHDFLHLIYFHILSGSTAGSSGGEYARCIAGPLPSAFECLTKMWPGEYIISVHPLSYTKLNRLSMTDIQEIGWCLSVYAREYISVYIPHCFNGIALPLAEILMVQGISAFAAAEFGLGADLLSTSLLPGVPPDLLNVLHGAGTADKPEGSPA